MVESISIKELLNVIVTTVQPKEIIMTIKQRIPTLFVGAFIGAAILLSVGAATNQGTAKVWEYKTITGHVSVQDKAQRLDVRINGSTSDGWEFVTAAGIADSYGFAVMKREVK